MTEMIERMAWSMTSEWGADLNDLAPVDRDRMIDGARAALEAMREPTVELIASCGDLPGSQQEYWRRSIDAALEGL